MSVQRIRMKLTMVSIRTFQKGVITKFAMLPVNYAGKPQLSMEGLYKMFPDIPSGVTYSLGPINQRDKPQ